ncbi:rCG39032 [Rattus norvegicus]|uniref:RCG39032 n=1 Tax=Rattus norvegicus TaxID=10116 RepID=A6JXX6_RAT|nr:rCG39032 [Rattus norvegicus]
MPISCLLGQLSKAIQNPWNLLPFSFPQRDSPVGYALYNPIKEAWSFSLIHLEHIPAEANGH